MQMALSPIALLFSDNSYLMCLLYGADFSQVVGSSPMPEESHTNEIENFVHLFLSKTKQANSPSLEGFDDSMYTEVEPTELL